MTTRTCFTTMTLASLLFAGACGAKKPAAGPSAPNPFPGAVATSGSGSGSAGPVTPPPPPGLPGDPAITSGALPGDPFAGKDPDFINNPETSPLKPVFFEYDSDMISDEGRKVLEENAQVLKRYSTWTITVEGHCDERGTSEYNLALGDRRALAVKNYLQTLGVPAARLTTVSYGKEFPFDPGHAESSWYKNRRAHFIVTATK